MNERPIWKLTLRSTSHTRDKTHDHCNVKALIHQKENFIKKIAVSLSTSSALLALFLVLLIFFTSLIIIILFFISCLSLNDLLFIHFSNSLSIFCIHFISNLFLSIIHILCSIIYVATISIICCNSFSIFPSKSRKHVLHTCE